MEMHTNQELQIFDVLYDDEMWPEETPRSLHHFAGVQKKKSYQNWKGSLSGGIQYDMTQLLRMKTGLYGSSTYKEIFTGFSMKQRNKTERPACLLPILNS